MVEITGIIENIVFRNESNGFTVLDIHEEESGDLITAVGVLPFANEGERVRIGGEWTVHPDYGEQLKIERFNTETPSTEDAIEKYLASGLIKGIGPSTAKKLVKKFGIDTLDIIQYNPDRLTEVPGIGSKKAQTIATSFMEQMEI